jgi:hypothetical protein
MGSTYAAPSNSPVPQSEAQLLQQYAQYLPGAAAATEGQIVPTAQATTNATINTEPQLNALNLQQLEQYALPEAQVGQQISNANALAGAQTNLNQLRGPGGQAASAAQTLNEQLNPDYYAAQNAASQGAASAVGAINLGGLSPGESAATERSLNENNVGTGNLGLLNPENTISNALNFGGAFNSKIGLMNQAVGAASGAAGTASSNAGLNPTNVALGQPNTSTLGNFGTSQLSPSNSTTSAGSAGNVFNFGSGLLNQSSSLNSSNNALTGQLGSTAMNTGSPSTYLGDICCFIFLEAYHGKIPAAIRRGRNKFYFKNHDIATGYRRMARWLVPTMQKSILVRVLVWYMMVSPITRNLSRPCTPTFTRTITHFWLRLWSILGRNHKESEYSMTWRYVWA